MLDRLEGGEDEEDRRAKSLVEEELGQFSSSVCAVVQYIMMPSCRAGS